jgi:SAM-dependent methyltransferase
LPHLSACIICENQDGNKVITLRELQLGLNESFSYQLCNNCGSLQLENPPADFSKYYPNEDYYSFTHGAITELKAPGFLRVAKTKYLLYQQNQVLGALLSIGYKMPDFAQWMLHTGVKLEDEILDVGCGNGMLLGKLHKMGFNHLTGIDPFVNKEQDFGSVKILRKEIGQMSQRFDLIMMHHALEHMADPLAAMRKAHDLLNDDKFLLVRIPVMGNYGWKKYGEYWAGLDAPRHLFIPSEKGMRILAEKSGFELVRLEYDTVDYLIWCSEQYKNGISLYQQGSHMLDKNKSSFTPAQIQGFKNILAKENANGNGDTAAYFFKKEKVGSKK